MTNENVEEKFNQLYDEAVAGMRQHDISYALRLLLEAGELRQDPVKVDNLLASCYLVLGEYEQAVKCWEQILAIQPNHKSAQANLELYNRPSNQFWIKRYQQAVAEVEKKNYQIGGEMLRNLLLEQDGHVALYQLLGLCCLAGGDRHEAIKMWQKGLDLDRSNSTLQDYMDSLPRLKKIDLIPVKEDTPPPMGLRSRWVWAAAGALLVFLIVPAVYLTKSDQQPEPARPAISSHIKESKPVKTSTSVNMPAQSEQLKPPVEDLTAGGSNYDVEKEESYYLAGRRAYLSRNWKSAVDNYSVVVEMKTGSYLNREALYYLARTNYLRGELGLAEQYYLQYLKEFKDTAYYDDSLFYLGCIYWKQNNLTRAREVLQELKSIAPQSGYLSSNLCVKVMP